ncbi:MAG: ABC transporter permease [Conexivisphaerales archaeon]
MDRRRYALGAGGVLILLAVWWLLSQFQLVNPLFLPTPVSVVSSAYENADALARAFGISLFRLLVGFVIGVAIGVMVGILVGWVKFLQKSLLPIVDMIRSIPNLAWIPLAIVWFGIGNYSKFFVIALAVFFPVFTNTYLGVKNIDPVIVRASMNFGVSGLRMLYKVLLPASLGDIFIGLKVGMQSGIVAMIATEVVASTAGLGYIMDQASSFFKSGLVIAVMLSIGVLGYLLTQAMVRLERRFARWTVAIGER